MARSRRLGGIARTWLITAACSGARAAAYLNKEWIAASLALRVALPLPRCCSRCCRNCPMSAASRLSGEAELAGGLAGIVASEGE